MSSAIGHFGSFVIAILSGFACVGSYTHAVEETRAGLLGLGGRDLRQCLGIPSDFYLDGEVEQQTYRFEHDDEPEAVYGSGGIGGTSVWGRTSSDPSHDPVDRAVDARNESYCQIDFELTSGQVTSVSAQGRTREGLNADSTCLLRARRCVRYADEDEVSPEE